eukprot:CCRYP_013672-RA/>CCRYP_013672-RA protein AED:0.17 eAED:0.19 QI:0/0.8/0.63/1/0.8/0.54/11/835/482
MKTRSSSGDVVVKSAKETTCNGTSSDQCKCISLYYRINSYNLLANNTCFHPHDDSHTRPDGDDGGYQEDPILLPQSTHSLLFTEPIGSIPFGYAFGIVILSLVSLLLALVNNLDAGTPGNPLGVPVQVDTSVRIAQYFGRILGLLMEEEIPSSFYLLQMIPKYSLKRKLPRIKYWRFVSSAVLRLVMGYVFILNMFLVVAQGTGVLDIFYDVLALQFLQVIDDIAFRLAKISTFGKRLKWATNKKIFLLEFDRMPFSSRKKMSVFLKSLYVLNLSSMVGGMFWVTYQQMSGSLHCNSVFVTFPEDVWQDALVETPSGEIEHKVLMYSYFNGVYGTLPQPRSLSVYTEQSKVTGESYRITTGAEIKYCKSEGAWVFMHKHIRKSNEDDNDCPWLLRSPDTTEYDLLSITGSWTVWAGSSKQSGSFSALCDECSDISQCVSWFSSLSFSIAPIAFSHFVFVPFDKLRALELSWPMHEWQMHLYQ